MCSAWYGGLGAGLLATVLSAVAGQYFLLEPLFSLAFDDTGDVIGMILYIALGASLSWLIDGLHRARRQVERHAGELARQREWFRVTLASIGDAVVATDADGQVAFMNAVAQEVSGWSEAQAAGQPLAVVLPLVNEQTREPVENPVDKVLRTGGIVGLANHTVLVRRDGAELPIDDSAAPIRGRDGIVDGVVLVFRDVTERRRMANELEQRAADLVAADRHKNEFLATLAHELRNALAPIHNSIHVLKRTAGADAAGASSTAMIDRQCQLMRRLVDDLLDISRISRGMLGLRKEPLELAVVVRQAVDTARPLLDAGQHTLVLDIPAEPIRLEGDAARLHQVIVNLLSNAARYTDTGGRIVLSVATATSQAVIRVRDDGMGIAPDVLPHLFALFARSERAAAHAPGGLGIGLHLVHRLVQMHGGSVQASSDGPGHGSEFVVCLPLGNLPDVAAPPAAAAERPSGDGAHTPHRVLVVDDNRDHADSLARLLRLWGHDVQTAYDGLAALEAAAGYHPHIALLDIRLPKLDGYELARRLRQQLGARQLVLIALSGSGDDDPHAAGAAGFDLHLIKPVDPAMLESVLAAMTRAEPLPPAAPGRAERRQPPGCTC